MESNTEHNVDRQLPINSRRLADEAIELTKRSRDLSWEELHPDAPKCQSDPPTSGKK